MRTAIFVCLFAVAIADTEQHSQSGACTRGDIIDHNVYGDRRTNEVHRQYLMKKSDPTATSFYFDASHECSLREDLTNGVEQLKASWMSDGFFNARWMFVYKVYCRPPRHCITLDMNEQDKNEMEAAKPTGPGTQVWQHKGLNCVLDATSHVDRLPGGHHAADALYHFDCKFAQPI